VPTPVEHRKLFIKAFDSLAHHRERHDVFSDFLEMAVCAIRKRTMPPGPAADTIEDQYMAVVKRNRSEDVRAMPRLLGITTLAIQDGGCDFLLRSRPGPPLPGPAAVPAWRRWRCHCPWLMRLESSENRHFPCPRFMRMSPDCCDSASWFVRICLQDDVTARLRDGWPPAAYPVNFRLILAQTPLPPPIRFVDSHEQGTVTPPAEGFCGEVRNSPAQRSKLNARSAFPVSMWSWPLADKPVFRGVGNQPWQPQCGEQQQHVEEAEHAKRFGERV
jgi:hypothetical protein